jgi:hypothetical protein
MSGETIVKIAEAADGHKSSLDGTEKIPAAPSNYIEVADIKNYITSDDLNFGSNKITGLGDPSSAQDAATKSYVDGLLANVGKRQRVRAATTANITISTALNNGDTLDGVTLATGDLVLVKDQSTVNQNGVYVVGASPARFEEFDTYDEHPGSLIAVEEGSTNADTLWLCTSNVGGTLGSTSIVFASFTIGSTDSDAIHLSTANEISTLTEKTTLADNDLFVIEDSAASGAKKKFKAVNLPGGGGGGNIMSSRPYGTLDRSYSFDSTIESWTSPSGTLTSDDNALKFVTSGDVAATEPSGAADVADGELICDIKFDSGTDGGVAFRKSDDSNFYFLLMSGSVYTLYKKVSGS